VRGVLEIIRPLDKDEARVGEALRLALLLSAVGSCLLLGVACSWCGPDASAASQGRERRTSATLPLALRGLAQRCWPANRAVRLRRTRGRVSQFLGGYADFPQRRAARLPARLGDTLVLGLARFGPPHEWH
jgi:hypothetical protein